ncbi:uncharacterized protein LOC143660194 [Tamandua tetradactyla]|uniref:uncharacterized protein LOC143660194 n=1 Tax=Tamandua tetradactyla TaxID=48850 RepID=UPI0040539242
MTRIILPQMVTRGRGVVINISSEAENGPRPFFAAYGATKVPTQTPQTQVLGWAAAPEVWPSALSSGITGYGGKGPRRSHVPPGSGAIPKSRRLCRGKPEFFFILATRPFYSL